MERRNLFRAGATRLAMPHVAIWTAAAFIVYRSFATQPCVGLCGVVDGAIVWIAFWSALALSATISATQLTVALLRSKVDRQSRLEAAESAVVRRRSPLAFTQS